MALGTIRPSGSMWVFGAGPACCVDCSDSAQDICPYSIPMPDQPPFNLSQVAIGIPIGLLHSLSFMFSLSYKWKLCVDLRFV
jgi:hypothetical protein